MLLFDSEPKKLSRAEQKAGNQLFFWIMVLIFLSVLIFFVGQFFELWTKNRSARMDELHIRRQVVFASGNVERILPSQDAVYFETASDETWRMLRTLPSWLVVKPEKLPESDGVLLGINDTGSTGFFRQDEGQYALKNMSSGEETPITPPDASAVLVRADFSSDDKLLAAETSEGVLWQWDAADKSWTSLGKGRHAEYEEYEKTLWFERDGQIIRRETATGVETIVTNGSLPSLSQTGDYLAYVAESAQSGQPEVFICQREQPEETFQLSNHALTPNARNHTYMDIAWDTDTAALYVTRSADEAGAAAEVKYYQISGVQPPVEVIAADWLEGCIMGDDEAVAYTCPQGLTSQDAERLRLYGLGFSAQEKDNGMEGKGLYQDVTCQFQNPQENLQRSYWEPFSHSYWTGMLYFDTGREGYALQGFMTRAELHSYLENGMAQLKTDGISEEPRTAETFGHILLSAYNQGHDDLMLIQHEAGQYQAIIIRPEGDSRQMPLTLPEGSSPISLSFSEKGHVGALMYEKDGKQGILILNLKEYMQIPSVFLSDVKKAFWSTEQLIVYSESPALSVRWVYAPSEGTLHLHE